MTHTFNIGGIPLPNPLLLAPMAGFTDKTFRSLCHRFGCGLTFSEMVSAKSIVYGNTRTWQLLDNDSDNRPWVVQFFGHEPEVFAEAIRRLNDVPFDIVDINMGCPVPKIVKNGEGSALMNDPVLAGRIIEAAVRASHRPVTVKIRKGFSAARANAVELARIAQESGASLVAVHGRTRDQFYAGTADWDCIAHVKAAVRIPVAGNGDVFDPESAARLRTETGCDGVMIARGALGNPWLFTQALAFLSTGAAVPLPEWSERAETAVAHLRDVIAHKGESVGIAEMRKHLSFYVKGLPNATRLRRLINAAPTADAIVDALTLPMD